MKLKQLSCVLALLFFLVTYSMAESLPPPELSEMATVELQELLDDISSEIKGHHELKHEEEKLILSIVKDKAEQFYASQGIKITWAWIRYDYSRNRDLYSLETHLDYKDATGKAQKKKVIGEMFPIDGSLTLIYLQIGDQEVINYRSQLPENLLLENSPHTINDRTGMDLSVLDKSQLKQLEGFVREEINTNHKPKGATEGKVHSLVKAAVEEIFSEKGISISWPWFDYSYTNDWGCYTENTRISYKDTDGKKQDRSIYAEIFPENDSYGIYFLKIGEEIIFDHREQLTSASCLQFLNSRDYLAARDLAQAGDDEAAALIWRRLGSFADSSKRAESAQDRVNSRKYSFANELMENREYEAAVLTFEELGDYLDSANRVLEAKKNIADRDYRAAQQLMKDGHFERAIEAFEALEGYGDSVNQISACMLAIKSRDYEAAKHLLDEGKDEEALKAFRALGDYSDSETQTRAIETAIIERQYASANDLMLAFQFEQAIKAFEEMNGYSDSAEKIAQCKAALESIDRTIEISQSEIALYIKQSYMLKPVAEPISPDAPKSTKFLFSSSDERIVKVTPNGAITGVSAGHAYVSFVAQDNAFVGGRTLVRVMVPVSKLTLNVPKLDLQLSSVKKNLASDQLSVSVTPENAQATTIVWASSNEKVATVDQNGLVKAVGKGQARITATSKDTPGTPVKVTCSVTVAQAVESVSILNSDASVFVGKVTAIKTEVLPKDAVYKKLTWTSSDPAIASVSADGKVKGVSPGTATITALSAGEVSASFQTKVEPPPITLRITASARLIDRNHVGSRWTKGFQVDDIDFTSSAQISVQRGQTIRVFCWITENDKNPETGTLSETIEITEEIAKRGITIDGTVYVTENGGRYSGNSATWEVTIKIMP